MTGIRSRERINVMGGLRYHDRKNLSFFVDKGNSESFFESLEKLNQFIKAEWVKQGNKLALYERIEPRVLVILDNASYHKREARGTEDSAPQTSRQDAILLALRIVSLTQVDLARSCNIKSKQ